MPLLISFEKGQGYREALELLHTLPLAHPCLHSGTVEYAEQKVSLNHYAPMGYTLWSLMHALFPWDTN